MDPPSTTYVALLRGINVNGHRILRMAELRASLEREGSFSSVKTWMQSGNVLFQSPLQVDDLAGRIRSVIEKDFGIDDVPVMIRTGPEMEQAVANNPFVHASEKTYEAKRLFAAFLDQVPCPKLLQKMDQIDYSPEEYRVNKELKMIYSYVPNFAKYKLDTTLFEKRLDLMATSRNWRTMNKLVEMARDITVARSEEAAAEAPSQSNKGKQGGKAKKSSASRKRKSPPSVTWRG